MTRDDDMDLFLLAGQSNMAGRGYLDKVDPIVDPRIRVLHGRRWYRAQEPLHRDKPERAGVGLAMSFAVEVLRRRPDRLIGFIPSAFGGSPLSRWAEGADLFERAVSMARTAMQTGQLCGILWHQGESDCDNPTGAKTYGTRLRAMVRAMRRRLGAPNMPFVAGELGTFVDRRFRIDVNRQARAACEALGNASFVSARGLGHRGDNLHFNSAALRVLGVRYARKYLALQ